MQLAKYYFITNLQVNSKFVFTEILNDTLLFQYNYESEILKGILEGIKIKPIQGKSKQLFLLNALCFVFSSFKKQVECSIISKLQVPRFFTF